MATYKGIKGVTIQYLDSDPPNPIVGQVFYNSTSNTLKGVTAGVGAWSSGENLPVATDGFSGSAGTATAGLAFGGQSPPGITAATYEYDGTNWTTGGSLATARQFPTGAGTQTAGLATGGESPSGSVNSTEEYNGSTWSSGGNFPATVNGAAGSGLQTAAVVVISSTAAEYDGSSWTASNALNTSRAYLMSGNGAAPQTACWVNGGPPTASTGKVTEEYDGTNWTSGNNSNVGRSQAAGAGSQTTAILMGGGSPAAAAEEYDGTSWTSLSNMNITRVGGPGGFGSNTSAVTFGGQSPGGRIQTTEEYNVPATAIKTFTTS